MRNTVLPVFSLVLLTTILGTESGGTDGHTLGTMVPVAGENEPVSFDRAEAGQFNHLETAIGTWVSEAGRAIIDNKHAKSGTQCLQLTGGEKTSIILQLAGDVDRSGMLTFWAERWTSRTPFSFRIEMRTGDVWQEIFNGDATVRVGRSFLNHVNIPLGDEAIEQLRFTVTSPPNTGVLIDDLRIAPAQPQEILSAEMVPVVLPALVGAESSPLAKLRIKTSGILNPISIAGLRGTLDGTTDLQDLVSIHVDVGKNRHKSLPTPDGSFAFSFPESAATLEDGENYLWIGCELSADADIDHGVGATVTEVTFSNGESHKLDASPSPQRMGVAVRQGGNDGVHTYRIPGLATTNQGTLIGVYDIRHRGSSDLPGDIDVGMSRSTDGGRTWEPMKTIMNMGNDPQWHYDGIGDPAVLVDRNTGTIWVAGTWSHGNRSWRGSSPGMTPEETGQLMLVRSDDDGVTWSQPVNITSQVKHPEWSFILQGPGKGVTTRDGTLIFAAQYQDPPKNRRLPHSTIIYSKDHGETWHVGSGAFDDTTEAQVVEVEPGVLMLNCRYNHKSARVVMTTCDMGRTWQKHPTSERALIEPGACMASLIDADREAGTDLGGWLLFSNPDSIQGRRRISIKASPDRGLTWPKQHRLLLDEGGGRGYSCLTMIDATTVGILYEGSRADITFQRIPLADLIGRAGRLKPPVADEAGLRLPQVFGDQMVLQADAEIPVWGQARPQAKVAVTLGDETRMTTADADGRWQVRLARRKANALGETLQIRSAQELVAFNDVVIGEVWVCAGQSNMQWSLAQSTHGAEELAAAEQSNLRLLDLAGGATGRRASYAVEHLARLTPETFCEGAWQRANAESARDFSAVAWYFGRHLERELDVPVGLICPAVGGTPTEAWIPQPTLAADPQLKGLVAGNWLDNPLIGEFCRVRGEQNLLGAIQAGDQVPGNELGPNHPFKPGFMWSAGIDPLVPYAIRGVIWYQGESNAETPESIRLHRRLFPLLIEQWRDAWGQGDFPFLFVQLPAIDRTEWPLFRDGQRRVLDQLDNVGMAVTIDTGLAGNVHPPLKKPVGERLAVWALGTTYRSASHAIYSGPLLATTEREGDSLIVSLEHVGAGLATTDGQPPRHFEICGPDGVFRPAEAKIVGTTAVAVSCPQIAKPAHVRYAWRPFPSPPVNLVNSAGLPTSPFTTENEEEVFARRNAPFKSGRPNVVFIVSEDNSDHLGCYGENRVHTPNLDGLASGGVRYTRAYVPYSVCSPSRAAFLTGLYTRQTGHIGLATHRFSMYRQFKTIPAYLQAAGYYTGFLGKTHVNPEEAVEKYIDYRAIRDSNFGKTTSIVKYAAEARVVMEQAAAARKPFLLIINYADAHRRFVRESKHGFPTVQVEHDIPPYPWIGSDTPYLREELRDYLNCINRLDEGVGMVLGHLDEMSVRDNALVIYISDHGADFPRAKGSIYENGMRIPMIVNCAKSFPKGKVEDRMVSTIDILPTILRETGLPAPEELPGYALQDIDSGAVPPRRYIHTFTTGSSPNLLYLQFGIRDERYKLVYNPDRALNRLALSRYQNSKLPENQRVQVFLRPPEFELFDLQEDPYEWTNLADSGEHRTIKARLLKAMQQFQREIKDPFAEKQNMAAFIAEQKEYLQKPYKTVSGFRWPHLGMFEKAQKVD